MLVRAARIEDVATAARVHHEASEVAYAGIQNASSLASREAMWQEVITNPDRWPYVVEENQEVVGVLIVGPASEGRDAGEVYVIYVHPNWWGTGAGQRLIERGHQELRKRFRSAVLTVLASNGRARRFYERNDWELSEVKTELHFGGVPTEVAVYRKKFQ